jgi:hypothetical protein
VDRVPTVLPRIRLTIEDGLARIQLRGTFDTHVASAVWAEFQEIASLADAIRLDLGAVTQVEVGYDLTRFLDELQRHCWISGCQLQVVTVRRRPGPHTH